MNIERHLVRSSLRKYLAYLQIKEIYRKSYHHAQNEVGEAFAPQPVSRKMHVQRKYISHMEFPRAETAPEMTCKSQKLFLENCILQPGHSGAYHYMPLGLRALEKLIRVIDEELQSIGAQKMSMPTMMQAALWEKTGRWATSELFKLQDRLNREYCLGPTHEESITKLVSESSNQLSYRRLPLMVYQITRKFRDEMSPRYGLLRGREFEMKDLYTFDTNVGTAKETYELVCEAYCSIFERLGLNYIKVQGATGNIGGVLSHEYHLPADTGEDTLHICVKCGLRSNSELLEATDETSLSCPSHETTLSCPSHETPLSCPNLRKTPGIEVGHGFLLGTKYSQVFSATYTDEHGKPQIYQMGCYGLGISRILQASVEVLSTDTDMIWPQLIAPYQICIIPQAKGFAYEKTFEASELLYDSLTNLPNLRNEVVIDDRTDFSIGRRVKLAKKGGYPYVIAAGKKALESPVLYEVINLVTGDKDYLTLEQVTDKLSSLQTVQVV